MGIMDKLDIAESGSDAGLAVIRKETSAYWASGIVRRHGSMHSQGCVGKKGLEVKT
jgi:hypothetical protein